MVETVLHDFFGTDRMTVTVTNPEAQITRSFASFSEIAQSVEDARVWAGIHFRSADIDGTAMGRRIAAYALHPAGFVIEWVATRPIHFLVSQPGLEKVFGHVPHESPFGGYEAYEPEPSSVRFTGATPGAEREIFAPSAGIGFSISPLGPGTPVCSCTTADPFPPLVLRMAKAS